MEHDGGSHRRAEIGRALGEVAYALVKGVFQLAVKDSIYLIRLGIRLLKRKTCLYYLNSDVILLAEHNAHALVGGEQQSRAVPAGGEFRADKVLLGERDRLNFAQALHINIAEVAAVTEQSRFDGGIHLLPALGVELRREREFIEVSRKPDPGAQDYIALLAFINIPFAHFVSPPSDSRLFISSRSFAACSNS